MRSSRKHLTKAWCVGGTSAALERDALRASATLGYGRRGMRVWESSYGFVFVRWLPCWYRSAGVWRRSMNVLVSGAKGLIGSALIPELEAGGHRIDRLTRSPRSGEDIRWDPEA